MCIRDRASTMILNEVCKYELLKKEEQEKQQEECKHIENKKVDDSKDFSDTRNDEKLSPAFNIALAAALAGSFKELVNLKDVYKRQDLAALYVADMQAEGVSPNAENAAEWLLKYENEHLYQ